MKTAVRLVVQGRVQGVGFRWFVQQQARKFVLLGWVKNLASGSVEIFVEGEQTDITDFMVCIKKGPAFSRVIDVVTEWHDYSGRYQDFKITY